MRTRSTICAWGRIFALVGDAKSGEPEACSGDAGHAARIAAAVKVVASAIEHLAGLVAGLLPEEETGLAFEIVEESFDRRVSGCHVPRRMRRRVWQ